MVSDLIEVVFTSLYPFLRRCWAPKRGRGEPVENIGQLPPVVHLASVVSRAQPGVFGGARSGVVPMQRGLELQGVADSPIVLARLELAAQFGKRSGDVDCCLARVHPQVQQEGLNPGMGV